MTEADQKRFVKDLIEARMTARQVEMMLQALRSQVPAAHKQDLLVIEIRISDLRLLLNDLQERATDQSAEQGGTTVPEASTSGQLH